MGQTIAIFGGAFSPPTEQHRMVAVEVSKHFDQLIVMPCGPRPDEPMLTDITPTHRAAMVDLCFATVPGLEIDLSDLELDVFTRTEELQRRFEPRGDVWHVVGAELVRGGASGQSRIQTTWQDGPQLWRRLQFGVITWPGAEVASRDLPPRARVIPVPISGSATRVRAMIRKGMATDGLLSKAVGAYVRRHELYQNRLPGRSARIDPIIPRPIIVADERNLKARELIEKLDVPKEFDQANCVVAIGGDGTMLSAIQLHWRKRLPFIGLNAGHLGFLLNSPDRLSDAINLACWCNDPGLVARQMPMIYVETADAHGAVQRELTFNDAWIERSSPQTAWLRVSISGQERIAKLVCDGLLVSTAAGSTAYALSMGANPLLADTPAWLVVGSNVMSPLGWKSAMLPLDDFVEVEVLNPEKRPVQGFAFGKALGDVRQFRARISRVAAVELAFLPDHDLAYKIKDIQFRADARF